MRCVPNVALAGVSIVIHRLALASLLVSVGGYAHSQPADWPRPMERSEPHEALAFYEGTWTVPGKDDWRETCSWLAEGRRHIVCRPRWQVANGALEGLSVFSYDETSGEYLSHRFKPGGRVSTERCQRIPKGFRCMNERGKGADQVRERFTIEEGVAGRVSTVFETAKADRPWVIEDSPNTCAHAVSSDA